MTLGYLEMLKYKVEERVCQLYNNGDVEKWISF